MHIHLIKNRLALVLTASLCGFALADEPHPERPPREQDRGVEPASQLLITDLRVIEDRDRTDPRQGRRAVWTFKHLMEQMAGDQNPSTFALRWLETWEQDQQVNGFHAAARPAIRELVIDPWLAVSGGRRLDLSRAPFKLLAIVNRMDLRVHDGAEVTTAGEGRFVFGLLDPEGNPLPPIAGTAPGGFVVIFEYELPATNMDALRTWTMDWKNLDRHKLGSREYNDALERITRKFSDRGSAPDKPNGNALNQIRTNEIALALPWELREFVISGDTGLLTPHTMALTPDTIALNGTELLANFINANEEGLLDGSMLVGPEVWGASSLSGPFQATDFPDFDDRTFTVNTLFGPFSDIPWSAAGILNNEARHAFALNTCNGCHRDETGASFLQIGFPMEHELPRSLANPAELAGFLTGIAVPDPVVPETERSFNDLERRKTDLEGLITTFEPDGRGRGPRGHHRPRFVH